MSHKRPQVHSILGAKIDVLLLTHELRFNHCSWFRISQLPMASAISFGFETSYFRSLFECVGCSGVAWTEVWFEFCMCSLQQFPGCETWLNENWGNAWLNIFRAFDIFWASDWSISFALLLFGIPRTRILLLFCWSVGLSLVFYWSEVVIGNCWTLVLLPGSILNKNIL